MEILTKGFNDTEVAERIKAVCIEKINAGMSEFINFGRLWGITYDIAYRGNGVIEITNN